MEVKNCRSCKRLFNYVGGGYLLCPACMEELEKKFAQVKQYIYDNPKATMPEIAEANDIETRQIERWVREERLTFGDDSPVGIECENCGATIKSGRFCPKCKDAMAKGLGSLYKTETPKVERRRAYESDGNKMRFLG